LYLHIGKNVVVPEEDVIGIFDLDNTTGSIISRRFLSNAEKNGCVISVSDELPKSFVVCNDVKITRGKSSFLPANAPHYAPLGRRQEKSEADIEMTIYLSQLSSQTLAKRSGAALGALNY